MLHASTAHAHCIPRRTNREEEKKKRRKKEKNIQISTFRFIFVHFLQQTKRVFCA